MKKKIFNFFIFISLENIFISRCSLIFRKDKYAIYFIENLIIMEIWMVEGVLVDPFFPIFAVFSTQIRGYQDLFNDSYFHYYDKNFWKNIKLKVKKWRRKISTSSFSFHLKIFLYHDVPWSFGKTDMHFILSRVS